MLDFHLHQLKTDKILEVRELNYDPDEDGFLFGIEHAIALQKRVHLFNLIRKSILANNHKLFELALDDLNERLPDLKCPDWSNERCDLGLLIGANE